MRFRERFLAETELAASLEHPNVVPIHDAGEVDGQLYIAMRYVEGGELNGLLQKKRPLEPGRALAICGQTAAALDAAHARGLVHRDVKPSNVLLGDSDHVYLTDFGLSRRLSEPGDSGDRGLSVGTPAYAAPEQIEGGDADSRSRIAIPPSLANFREPGSTGYVPTATHVTIPAGLANFREPGSTGYVPTATLATTAAPVGGGLDWVSALIGAGAGLGIAVAGAGGLMSLRKRRTLAHV